MPCNLAFFAQTYWGRCAGLAAMRGEPDDDNRADSQLRQKLPRATGTVSSAIGAPASSVDGMQGWG